MEEVGPISSELVTFCNEWKVGSYCLVEVCMSPSSNEWQGSGVVRGGLMILQRKLLIADP